MSEIVVTEQNFEGEVLNASVPVLVDFWAPWCGPCKMIAPVVAELASEYADRLKVGKLNTDENLNVAGQYQITSIPTLLIFKDKKPVQRIVGFKSKNELKRIIDSVLE
jgi:thioredoxin